MSQEDCIIAANSIVRTIGEPILPIYYRHSATDPVLKAEDLWQALLLAVKKVEIYFYSFMLHIYIYFII
jgi:hypothetical protein